MAKGAQVEPKGRSLGKATLAAKTFLLDLAKEGLLGAIPIKDVVLEEAEQTPQADWLITLGYRQESPSPYDEMAGAISGLRPRRSDFFKTFKVKRTGEVVAMKLREPVRG
jgi:hypothetical protein